MKTLLALLLLCSLAMGQVTINKELMDVPSKSGFSLPKNEVNVDGWEIMYLFNSISDTFKVMTVIGKDTVYTASPFGMVTIHSIVKFWDEYKKECWNDSTAKRKGWWTQDMGYSWFIEYSEQQAKIFGEPKITYTHRDPTFPGFMEYLRRKTK